MIPKKIHCCWYGKNPKSELLLKCMESWQRHCPDWEIKLWDEENTDMDHPYIHTAYMQRNFANMSNFTRLQAIANEGGIYLDSDIELLKSLEPFRQEKCFFGFQDSKFVNNAVMGAVKDHPFVMALLTKFTNRFDGQEKAHHSSPNFVTDELRILGLRGEDDINKDKVMIDGVSIFPQRYFYPYNWNEKFHSSCIKSDTVAIHHWTKLWGKKWKMIQGLKNYAQLIFRTQ